MCADYTQYHHDTDPDDLMAAPGANDHSPLGPFLNRDPREIVLPPEVAQAVLTAAGRDDVSLRAIERAYEDSEHPFSRRWLCRRLDDGSILEMAQGNYLGLDAIEDYGREFAEPDAVAA